MDKRRFGTFINLLRKEKGITQKELAEILCVTDKAVSRWETGKSYPDIEIMQRIAEYFNVTVNELLQGERIPDEQVKVISDKNIVSIFKKIKKNQNLYFATISVTLVIAIVMTALLAQPVENLLRGVKTADLDITSRDTCAILSCIDGYINDETGGYATINDVDIMMCGDMTLLDLNFEGATVGDTRIFCKAWPNDIEEGFPVVHINMNKEPWKVNSPVDSSSITDFVDSIDLKQFDKDFSTNNIYGIMMIDAIDGYGVDYIEGMEDGKLSYYYDDKSGKFICIEKGERIKAPYVSIDIMKYKVEDDCYTGESLVHVFWSYKF